MAWLLGSTTGSSRSTGLNTNDHELLGKAKNTSLGDMSLKLLFKGTPLSKLNNSEGNIFDQTKIAFKEDRSLTID